MLVDEPKVLRGDPILSMIAALNGNVAKETKLATGVYQVGHFGSSDFLRGYNEYPDLGMNDAYGVCDGLDNLLDKLPILNDPERQFVVTLTSVKRANQEPSGGWRWRKWGEYIGKHKPQHEYLYDERDIDEVFCYHVYEKV